MKRAILLPTKIDWNHDFEESAYGPEGRELPLGYVGGQDFEDFVPPSVKWVETQMEKELEKDGRFSRKKSPVSVVYGSGSIGCHEDDMTGVTAVCLVRLKALENAQQMDTTGDFFCGGTLRDVTLGHIVIFDDRETHAWLTNTYWTFIGFPVTRRRKP